MKKLLVLFITTVMTLVFTTSCETNFEHEFPDPGYTQSEEILPPTVNPIVELRVTPNVELISVDVPFRVDVVAIHEDGRTEKVNYVSKFQCKGVITQTNINEFTATSAGDGYIIAEYWGSTGSVYVMTEQ